MSFRLCCPSVGQVHCVIVLALATLAACRPSHVAHQVATTPPSPRTLVILIGQGRGNALTWQSLRKNLLDPLQADLATLFTDDWRSSPLVTQARYSWWMPEHDDWGVVLEALGRDECGLTKHQWHEELCQVHGGRLLYGVLSCPSPPTLFGRNMTADEEKDAKRAGRATAALLALRYMLSRHIDADGLRQKYDWFVVTRSDHIHLCQHVAPGYLNVSSLWVPTGEHYHGWTDRHLVVSSKHVMQALNVGGEIVCNASRWRIALNKVDVPNIETMQKLTWSAMGLNVSEFQRTMFTVRAAADPTSWSAGEQDVDLAPFCVKVKYPTARDEAVQTCASRTVHSYRLQHALRDIVGRLDGCQR